MTNDTSVQIPGHIKLLHSTRFWWSVIVIPVGIVGNILCLLVVSQKQNRSISCSVYMGALAVCDTLVLVANGSQLAALYQGANMLFTDFVLICKASSFMLLTCSQCGSMIILALLLERVIAVMKPLKVASILSPRRSLIITLIICVLQVMFNVPQFLSFTGRLKPMPHCIPSNQSIASSNVYNMIVLFISGVLPLFGMLIMKGRPLAHLVAQWAAG